jgi:hypothetical protein
MTKLLNRVTGTYPQVIHCNGPRANRVIFDTVERELSAGRMPSRSDGGITVLYCDDRDTPGPLQGSLARMRGNPCAQPYRRMIGRPPGPWKNIYKLEMFRSGLALTRPIRYVMGLDAHDVLVGDLSRTYQEFDGLSGVKMLIGAEKSFFPIGGHPYKRALPPFKEFQEELAPNTAYRYLNSGCWIGEHEFVIEFFDRCLELAKGEYQAFEDDQAIFHVAFAEMWPRVVLDYSCTIFQNLCLVPDSEMAFVEGEKHAERRDCRSAAPPAQ